VCVFDPDVVRPLAPEELARLAAREARLRAAEHLIRAVDVKDTYTGEHSQSVARLVKAIAEELGLAPELAEQVRVAGLLHDLGKIGLPDEILKKPGHLTPQEQSVVRTHPQLGYSLLDGLELEPIDAWILHHHEHWDGTGYPLGLTGDEIPLGSRIILVADAYDAMVSERSYRRAASIDAALEEIRRMAGRQFDPAVVAALEAHLARAHGAARAVELVA
jgi:putative nucleotidyltransferase with HDIG domain